MRLQKRHIRRELHTQLAATLRQRMYFQRCFGTVLLDWPIAQRQQVQVPRLQVIAKRDKKTIGQSCAQNTHRHHQKVRHFRKENHQTHQVPIYLQLEKLHWWLYRLLKPKTKLWKEEINCKRWDLRFVRRGDPLWCEYELGPLLQLLQGCVKCRVVRVQWLPHWTAAQWASGTQ